MKNEKLEIDRLIASRKEIGISKMEAAKRIGISQPAYLRYEAGERTPSMPVIKEMANVFHTSVDYLLGNSESSEPDFYIVHKSEQPELFALVKQYYHSDEEQLNRLSAYLACLEKMPEIAQKK